MLGSRYLNPYFGSGIYTWAALISTVLAALAIGYFLGGLIGDRTVSATVLGAIVGLAALYLLALPSFAGAILGFVFNTIDDVRLGSLYSALAIMVLPVILSASTRRLQSASCCAPPRSPAPCPAACTAYPPPAPSSAPSARHSFSSR